MSNRGKHDRTPEMRARLSVAMKGKQNSLTHGHSSPPSPTYRSWVAMLTRCYNRRAPNYPIYGGRGISVCDAWHDFAAFLADTGERPDGTSLDRIDNNGNYEPGNCRWATRAEQSRNRRVASTDEQKRVLTRDRQRRARARQKAAAQ